MNEFIKQFLDYGSAVEFWKEKLDKNVERDRKNIHDLENLGWKVIVIWACEINEKNLVALAEKVAANLS